MRKTMSKEIFRTLSASFMLLVILSFTFVKAFHSHKTDSFSFQQKCSNTLSSYSSQDATNDARTNVHSLHRCLICDFNLSTFTIENITHVPHVEIYIPFTRPLPTYNVVKVSILRPSLRAPPVAKLV